LPLREYFPGYTIQVQAAEDKTSPGMGLNAYFTYQVVGFHGSGPVPYKLALTAVFVEGFVFVFLSLIGMRQWLVKIIPASIKVASGVGIGLFLTTIGLSGSAGIGAITSGGIATPVALGGCPAEYIDSKTGACNGHIMTSPSVSYYLSANEEYQKLIIT
jgi:AGZA family xanthine/uracil permease-like MFS transporter